MAAGAGSDLAHFTGLGSEREGAEKGQQGRDEKQKRKKDQRTMGRPEAPFTATASDVRVQGD